MEDLIRRRESQIVLSDQTDRYRRGWLPAEPKRVMILVHGFAEHLGRYDEMAMYFAQRGFAVHGYDQVGHGRTPGARGHADRFDRLAEDLYAFCERVAMDHPGLPITLVGHSMGGLVAAATTLFHAPPVDRLVLSGALLQLAGGGMRQSLSLGAARVLSLFAPRAAFATGLEAEEISRDPEVVRRYREDPFVKDRISARFATGMNQATVRVAAAAGRLDLPVLVLHGESDAICAPMGSRAFYAGLASGVAMTSDLKIYPGLRHEIFQESERETVWEDMLKWLAG